MAHTEFDISSLSLYDREGRNMDLVEREDADGTSHLHGKVYFQPISAALYDNQNFYMLKRVETAVPYVGGDVLSVVDQFEKYRIRNVPNAGSLRVGQIIREMTSTSEPDPHIDYNSNPNGIGWSPVFITDVDPANGTITMSKPALKTGPVDFEVVGESYVFPGENVGDRFVFRWSKKDTGTSMQGWPYLEDDAHAVDEYRVYRGKLYRCVTAYAGPYLGNEQMWKEVSLNRDEYGFFTYDVIVDQQNSPYIEKVVEKSVTYSSDMVSFRYPLEFNVAFNPVDEVVYENVLDVYYVYGDDGTEQKIISLDFYGEGVIEDERLTIWLANFGIKFNKYDAMMLKDYNLKEAMPDWVSVNTAMKQIFFNKEQVFPYIGTYRGLANLISLLGFHDVLHVKEYWKNINPSSVYFDRMLLVDISDMLDDGRVQNMSLLEFNRTVKFDDAMRKTGYIALSYEFTKDSGDSDDDGVPIVVETSDMTPSEVFFKLYRLRDKLKNEFLPTNVVIKDIIGEFLYFLKVTPKYWTDQTMIYQNEVGEDSSISMYPQRDLYIQSIESLYRREYASGADFPVYTFNNAGADPYESGQRYSKQRMAELIADIREYYGAMVEEVDDYYWEFGDDHETPIGCPVVLSFDVAKLTLGDVSGRRLSDFLVNAGGNAQNFFTVVEYARQSSPTANQLSDVTINPVVVFGHTYTHNISMSHIIEHPPIIDEQHYVGDTRSYNGGVYQCLFEYTGPYDPLHPEYWRAVTENVLYDIHTYTYTAGADVEITAGSAYTQLAIYDGETTSTFSCSGSPALDVDQIIGFLVDDINASGMPVIATDNGDGSFRIMSTVTDPFTVTAVSNCSVIGDDADDVAAGIVSAILGEGSPAAISAWADGGGSGVYHVQALDYDDHYVNTFEAAASYYTLENVDYLNMYEIEWNIKRVGGGQPYSFTWRGLLKDLHTIAHVLPYAGTYDVSAKAYDFMGGATIAYEPGLLFVRDKTPSVMAMAKYEDKFSYQLGGLSDVMLQDCCNSEVYDPCILMRDSAAVVPDFRVYLLDWDFYRRNMYTYDVSTDSGTMLWDTTLQVPDYLPWSQCSHPYKECWGVNTDFRLTTGDFGDARIEDLYYWKLENTVFNQDFLAGFHMWNPAPFDKVVFGRNTGSPYIEKLYYVCPQFVWARLASVSNVDVANVNTIDGLALFDGDVVLLKNQTDPSENGVYVAAASGGFFTLSRHSACDTAYKNANSFVVVSSGTVNAQTCWRDGNYAAVPGDSFADSPSDYYQCEYSASYAPSSPFDYMRALSDVIGSEQHQIMGLFSSHVIRRPGSPSIDVMHVTARNFDKYAYQFLSYAKNYDTSLYPYIPVDVITGSAYSFYEPHWAYSDQLMTSLEAEYPLFKREELFLAAPIMDVLNGLTNDVDYFVQNKYMSIDDGMQVGHLPTVLDENYLSFARTKVFPNGFTAPQYSLVFFAVNNLFAKRQFEWTLTDDVTGEEIVKIIGVPFLVWKFQRAGTYRLTLKVYDKNGNEYGRTITNYVRIVGRLDYIAENDACNLRRFDEIKRLGLMYGVQ
jgi:hypothetical protein